MYRLSGVWLCVTIWDHKTIVQQLSFTAALGTQKHTGIGDTCEIPKTNSTLKLISGWIQWQDMEILIKFQLNWMKIEDFINFTLVVDLLAYVHLKNDVWLNQVTWYHNNLYYPGKFLFGDTRSSNITKTSKGIRKQGKKNWKIN